MTLRKISIYFLFAAFALGTSAMPQKDKKTTAVAASKKVSKKDKKKKAAEPKLTPISGEVFSYAYGVSQVPGLKGYIAQTDGVDSTQYENFIAGMKEQYSAAELAKMRAIISGANIGKQCREQVAQAFNELAGGDKNGHYVDTHRLIEGFVDGIRGTATLQPDSAQKIVDAQLKYQQEVYKGKNADFLAQYKKEKGVVATPSGLLYKVIRQGEGVHPTDTSTVEVDYEGKLIDGTVFDSSYKRGQAATFKVGDVIKGWREAVKLMPVGSEYEVAIPYDLAYGEGGTRNIPGYSTLIFKIELKSVK